MDSPRTQRVAVFFLHSEDGKYAHAMRGMVGTGRVCHFLVS